MDNAAEIQHWVAIAKEVEIHKGGRGNPQALRDWYNDGADGQIDWGSEGDMADCIAIAGKYLDNPEGFCQIRHIDATGEPAGQASGEITKADEIDYTEVFSSKDGKPSDADLYEQVKVDAKAKFDVYPSAVANGWVVQEYKRRGGKYHKPVAKGLDESIADVLRHDLAHDNWHRMHGDEPCQSEADCARMRANYSEDKPIEVEKSDITIEKGDEPGHPFRGNQHSHLAREHFRARRSHKVSESQSRQRGNFKAARLHGQAMAAHKTAEILAEKNSPDYPKARQRAQEAAAKANLAHAVGKIRKDAAPLDPYNQQAESLVKEAEAETNKALALQKRGQYESAQYAHASAAELYRQAAEIEDDGNADVLDDLAKEADDAAKYCEFFYSQGENHSSAEITKGEGPGHPFRGNQHEDGQGGENAGVDPEDIKNLPPFQFQDKYQEKVIHSGWKDGNVYRHVLEGSGDVFRELSVRDGEADTDYIEKKLERIEGQLQNEKDYAAGEKHKDYTYELVKESEPDKLQRLRDMWVAQPCHSKEQETAVKLNLALIDGDFPAVKQIVAELRGLQNAKGLWASSTGQVGKSGPAEIDKATGKVPPFLGRPTSDDTPDGSQDWGWLGEGEEVDDSSTDDDTSTDDTSEAENG